MSATRTKIQSVKAVRANLFLEPFLYIIALGVSIFAVATTAITVKIGVFFLASTGAIYLHYRKVYRSRIDMEERLKKELLKNALDSLIRNYKEDKISNFENTSEFHIRTNVMLIKETYDSRRSRYLPMLEPEDEYLEFYIWRGDVPQKDQEESYEQGYREEELKQTYNNGEGCCGKALSENRPYYYDARNDPTKVEETMSVEALYDTEHVNSILSVPIYGSSDRDSVIGILNIDSKNDINRTDLTSNTVQALANQSAGTVTRIIEGIRNG